MFEWCIKHPTQVAVIALLVFVLGIVAAMRIPVQMIPDLDVRTISVVTRWPGATPQDVEKEILIQQEDYLQNVAGLQRMISSSSTGTASNIAMRSASQKSAAKHLQKSHSSPGAERHRYPHPAPKSTSPPTA